MHLLKYGFADIKNVARISIKKKHKTFQDFSILVFYFLFDRRFFFA